MLIVFFVFFPVLFKFGFKFGVVWVALSLVGGPFVSLFCILQADLSRPQWSRGLRRRFTAALLLRSWVRITPGAWMFVCCECCVLSCRGLYDGLITRPEESYGLWRVVVCDQEASKKTNKLNSLNITLPTKALIVCPLATLHEKQRTQIQDMLPQQYYNEKVHIFNT